jgi:hypothetical protein
MALAQVSNSGRWGQLALCKQLNFQHARPQEEDALLPCSSALDWKLDAGCIHTHCTLYHSQ